MASFAYPPGPPQPPLREATAADISRMALISWLSCMDHEAFPARDVDNPFLQDDAFAFFTMGYRKALLDPRTVVVVAEAEAENTSGASVVVGVCVWTLPEDSPRGPQIVPLDNYATVVGIRGETIPCTSAEDAALRYGDRQGIDRYLKAVIDKEKE